MPAPARAWCPRTPTRSTPGRRLSKCAQTRCQRTSPGATLGHRRTRSDSGARAVRVWQGSWRRAQRPAETASSQPRTDTTTAAPLLGKPPAPSTPSSPSPPPTRAEVWHTRLPPRDQPYQATAPPFLPTSPPPPPPLPGRVDRAPGSCTRRGSRRRVEKTAPPRPAHTRVPPLQSRFLSHPAAPGPCAAAPRPSALCLDPQEMHAQGPQRECRETKTSLPQTCRPGAASAGQWTQALLACYWQQQPR